MDEQFGAAILRDAASKDIVTACPAEKSGQDEFDFEYGEDFARHIEAFDPTFCKVLVRYNPRGRPRVEPAAGGPPEAPVRFSRRTRTAAASCSSCWCRRRRRSSTGSRATRRPTICKLRPRLMVEAIQRTAGAGVEPDVWKIEGLDRREDCEEIVAAARAGGRDHGRLHRSRPRRGRPQSARMARTAAARCRASSALPSAAPSSGIRWSPGGAKKATREQTVAEIAGRYREFVDLFERTGATSPVRPRRASDRNIVPLWRAKPCNSE